MNVEELGFRSSSSIRKIIEAIAKAHDVDVYQPNAKLVLNQGDEDQGDAMLEVINLGDNKISVESFCETSFGSMEFPLTTFFIKKSDHWREPIQWYLVGYSPDYEEEAVFLLRKMQMNRNVMLLLLI